MVKSEWALATAVVRYHVSCQFTITIAFRGWLCVYYCSYLSISLDSEILDKTVFTPAMAPETSTVDPNWDW